MEGDDAWNDEISDDDAIDDGDVDEDDDDVDESENEFEGLNLENYDPTLVSLTVGPGYYQPNDDEWEGVGESIGQHKHLKDLRIFRTHTDDIEMLFRGFAENTSIQTLRFTQCNFFRGEIFNVMLSFFENNHNFESLIFYYCCFESMRFLASALSQFDSLESFSLVFVRPDDTDEELQLLISEIGDEEMELLITALSGHSGMKKFHLNCTRIERNACAALATLLRSPESNLVELDLRSDCIDDEGAALFATGLTESSTLKELILVDTRDITEIGWMAIFAALNHCGLQKLDISTNRSINGTAALSLANALTNSRSLGSLDLSFNCQITVMGWQAICAALQSPNCALKTLHLCPPTANVIAISLANSLINNSNLTELIFCPLVSNNITINAWSAFSQALCNPSSIMSIFGSNHTLQKLCSNYSEKWLPENVRSLLCLNRENGKRQAARLKIIRTHFCKGFAVQPFVDMDLAVLPRALAWMSKQSESRRIDEHFYGFLLNTTTWLEGVATQVKRESKKQKKHR